MLSLTKTFSFDKNNPEDKYLFETYHSIGLLLLSENDGELPMPEPEFVKGKKYKISIEEVIEKPDLDAVIPMRALDVHTRHCCVHHGCKYGEEDSCPVYLGYKQQEFRCQDCVVGPVRPIKQSVLSLRIDHANHASP